jgi:hypothetical protein
MEKIVGDWRAQEMLAVQKPAAMTKHRYLRE